MTKDIPIGLARNNNRPALAILAVKGLSSTICYKLIKASRWTIRVKKKE